MAKYMLLMYHPAEQDEIRRKASSGDFSAGVSKEQFAEEGKRWGAFLQELKEAGVLVDNNGLAGIDVATTVRVRNGETQITDGPFAETKELLAGYFVLEVEDLDTALKYAARVPSAETGSIEVRPVWG